MSLVSPSQRPAAGAQAVQRRLDVVRGLRHGPGRPATRPARPRRRAGAAHVEVRGLRARRPRRPAARASSDGSPAASAIPSTSRPAHVPSRPCTASPTRRPSRACASSQARTVPGSSAPPSTSKPSSASGSALVSVANRRSRSTRNSSSSNSRCTASRSHGRATRSSGAASSGTSRISSVSWRLSSTCARLRAQGVARLALHLVHPVRERLQRAELAHPLGGRLLPDARDAGQVVARVAAQRREVGVLDRGEAVAGHHRGGVDAAQLGDPARRVEHRHVVADQLERVAVARGRRAPGSPAPRPGWRGWR